MKKMIVILACVSLASLGLLSCDDGGGSTDPTVINGMWSLEMTEDSNTCPDDEEGEEDDMEGTQYLLVEVNEDGSEITFYDCPDETGESCDTTGDTYDYDGATVEFSETETEDLEVPTMDCFGQLVTSVELTFTTDTESDGSYTTTMSIIGDDADACIDLMEAYFGEDFNGCTIETLIVGTKLESDS